ncbi:hypothetical protein BT93_L4649 [Corymbia citriodora subsp. variegata]|uniref:Uncharacterized protein n=1 Tax=Corymbia citriodora subsp. variegata TaxID=360336 RepID=A0A8T0CFV5_CORYI|nr:hypothetical protein BT93_L4649 [Corymbia citriodora subsp. variegata]
MAAETSAQSNPFIKQLAANDRPTRDHAVTALRSYLTRSTPFTPLEMLKLHKGLFYCMWSSDKPRPQQRLARDLASLVSILPTTANFLNFVSAFWTTIAREWPGIDNLRMNKFLFLVRQYVAAGFEFLAKREWRDEEALSGYLDILMDVPLNPREPKVPNGLRFHVMDVYVDELEKVDKERVAPIEELLKPLRKMEKDGMTKVIRKRAAEALDDERIREWTGEEPSDDDKDDDEAGKSVQLEDDEEEEDNGDFEGFDD